MLGVKQGALKRAILKNYPGANLVIELIVSNVWVNCFASSSNEFEEQSPYVPEKTALFL